MGIYLILISKVGIRISNNWTLVTNGLKCDLAGGATLSSGVTVKVGI